MATSFCQNLQRVAWQACPSKAFLSSKYESMCAPRPSNVAYASTATSPGPGRVDRSRASNPSLVEKPSGANLDLNKIGSSTKDQVDIESLQIGLIATDVDGTLLDSNQQLSERTERAIHLAVERGVEVVLATGKARGPWMDDVMPRLRLQSPTVFLQGLLVSSADGRVLYERTMEPELAFEALQFAQDTGLTAVAYTAGDRILCSKSDAHTDRLIGYREPTPETVEGRFTDIVAHIPIYKVLFMADDAVLEPLRPRVERLLGSRATVVTALHGMLEVLPPGASKDVGLSRVLDLLAAAAVEGEGHRGEALVWPRAGGMWGEDDSIIAPCNMMAVGDGENDIGMLSLAGFSVAMGNARQDIKDMADHVTSTNDNDGLARAIERFVLHPGMWCWD